MGALQLAHLPRSASQLTTGTFCNAEIGALHLGQAERGTIRLNFGAVKSSVPESAAHSARNALSIIIGTRWMTTLRKLPIRRPSTTQLPMNSAGCVASVSRNSIERVCLGSKRNAALRSAAFRGLFYTA